MRRLGLRLQVFLAILLVSLGAVLTVGLVARNALAAAFDTYLASLPTPAGRHAHGPHGPHDARRRRADLRRERGPQRVHRRAFVAVVIAAVVAHPARALPEPADPHARDRRRRPRRGRPRAPREPSGPTEVAALGDAFNRMADSLEEAEVLRRRLVADVAHELRNPIAAARAQCRGHGRGCAACHPGPASTRSSTTWGTSRSRERPAGARRRRGRAAALRHGAVDLASSSAGRPPGPPSPRRDVRGWSRRRTATSVWIAGRRAAPRRGLAQPALQRHPAHPRRAP